MLCFMGDGPLAQDIKKKIREKTQIFHTHHLFLKRKSYRNIARQQIWNYIFLYQNTCLNHDLLYANKL